MSLREGDNDIFRSFPDEVGGQVFDFYALQSYAQNVSIPNQRVIIFINLINMTESVIIDINLLGGKYASLRDLVQLHSAGD